MTPEQELALLDATVAGLDDELRDAFAELVKLIQGGMAPRDAVQQVMDSFQGTMAETMAVALSGILGQAVGATDVMELQVGAVSLSRKLWAESASVSETVQSVVTRHVQGFIDARRLALELFEGYGFRDPGAEPLRMNPTNPRLPEYMRRALLTDPKMRDGLERALARLQVDNLSTPALRAAYSEALAALDALEDGAGTKLLEKRLEVAFFERMRYFAARIARTELHRAYSDAEALRLMLDADVEFIQIRRTPGGGVCICSLMTGRDLYGLGPGVYPKALAPRPPFHPHCRCVMSPRLDLTGKKAKEANPDGDRYFLQRLDAPIAARIMGSQAKRDAVLRGTSAEAVTNSGRDPQYFIRRVGA
ncbi:MAG: hypothetical protein RLZZ524_3129 [Pseudomonadota bacterium]|jgi:type IV secretory pathway VirB2 component (pilin)